MSLSANEIGSGWIAAIVVGAVIFAWSVWWRWVCGRRSVPWPSWLAFMLENPYMLLVSPSQELVRRLNLAKGMSLLDLGCGAGRVTVPAAQEVGVGGVVYGLDCQGAMLEKLAKRAKRQGVSNIVPLKCDFTTSGLGVKDLDRVCMVTVLGEMPRSLQLAAIESVFDALKPGGIFSITEVIPDPCYIPRSTLKQMVSAAGFVVSEEHTSLLTYTVNFTKSP